MALINLKTTCPSCKEKLSTGSLKKPPVKKYEGVREAGECPHCKIQLDWFHDKSKVMKTSLITGAGISIGMLIFAQLSIASLIGVFIVTGIGGQFMAMNQLKARSST